MRTQTDTPTITVRDKWQLYELQKASLRDALERGHITHDEYERQLREVVWRGGV